MTEVLIIFFASVYLLTGLYLSLLRGHFVTRIINGRKIVSKKDKWVYVVFLASLAGLIASIVIASK